MLSKATECLPSCLVPIVFILVQDWVHDEIEMLKTNNSNQMESHNQAWRPGVCCWYCPMLYVPAGENANNLWNSRENCYVHGKSTLPK